jgi:hypothetical protein
VSLPATISAGPGGPFVTTTSVVSGTANPVAVPTVYTTTLDAVLADTGLTMRDGDVLLVLETISGSSFATGVTFTAVSGTVSTIYYATEDDWTATPPTVGIGLIAVAVTRGAVEIRGTTVDGRTATFRNTASTPGARRVSFLRSTLVP